MTEPEQWKKQFYRGLRTLGETSFPRTCPNCGKSYDSAEAFLTETYSVPGSSGLQEGKIDDKRIALSLFRNCICGSTLLEFFRDRRDNSEQGKVQRKMFEELLQHLVSGGYDREVARTELLKVLNGQKSDILDWDLKK